MQTERVENHVAPIGPRFPVNLGTPASCFAGIHISYSTNARALSIWGWSGWLCPLHLWFLWSAWGHPFRRGNCPMSFVGINACAFLFLGCACPPVLSYHDSCIHSSLVLTRSDSMWTFVNAIIHALTYALICRRLRADSCFSMPMVMLLAKFLTISTHGRTSQHHCLPHAQHIVTGLTFLTLPNNA